MNSRRLGGLEVPAVGYGAMALSPGMYAPIDDQTGLAALRHVFERGAGFVDTSDAYGHDFHNEKLIGRALAEWHGDEVVVATKFGYRFPPEAKPHRVRVRYASREVAVNAEPRFVREYALASLRRLGVERIHLWYPHFPDPEVPIEDTIGAMADLVSEGLVAHLGLSNVGADQLRRAVAVHPIAAVQVEWSMWRPIEADLLAAAVEHGVGIVAWSPLGSGFLTGSVGRVADGDFRANFDRFTPDNLAANNERYAPMRELAVRRNLSPGQLALGWLLHQYESVVPIPGSRSPAHIDENLAAAAIELSLDDLATVDKARQAFEPAGRSLLDI
jgi:aryl-alcohol dehydrogenase-like predicted oxidoreductase